MAAENPGYAVNGNSSLVALSNDGLRTPVTLWADPTTHALVTSGGSGGGGTQYPNGQAVVTPTGSVALGYDGTNVRAMKTDSQGDGFTIITDGTNAVNVLKSDGTAAGQNAELVAGAYKEVAGLSAGSLNADLLPSTDVSNYAETSLSVNGTYSGTLTFQVSDDNTNFVAVQGKDSGGNVGTTTTGTNVVYKIPRQGRYLRIRMTAYTSGTATGVVEMYGVASAFESITASQKGAWTVGSNSATGSAVPANAFYMGMVDSASLLRGLRSGLALPDNTSGDNFLATSIGIFNGTNWDRQRSATAAANTTGTGLLGVGNLMFDGTNWQPFKTNTGDATNSSASVLSTQSFFYNGATVDRPRNNTTAAVIAAGATSSNAGVSVTTYNASKAVIIVNVTAITGTLTVTINAITASGYSYPILVSTAIATTGTTPLRIGEGLTASANAVANDILPRTIQVVTAVTGTCTYGVDNELSV